MEQDKEEPLAANSQFAAQQSINIERRDQTKCNTYFDVSFLRHRVQHTQSTT